MGERRQRFGLGRRRREENETAEAPAPCVPCGKAAGLRSFALNPTTIDRIDDTLVPELDAAIADAIIGGEVVLFDPRTATSTLLNATAALIWASIDGEATVAAIADDLARETGADREVIAADVRETIARFVDASIITDPAGSDPGATDGGKDAADDHPGARHELRRRRIEAVLARRRWVLDEVRHCAGATVRIRTDSPELADLLAPAIGSLPAAGADAAATAVVSVLGGGHAAHRRFRVVVDTETMQYAATAGDAVDSFFAELNKVAIDRSPGLLLLHAGAVERDGSITVVAGPSGRGKTTLTAALVQRGWTYLTDEVVAIDPATLQVRPYPKPFDLGPDSAAMLGVAAADTVRPKGKVAVDELGHVGSGTGRVALVVLLEDPVRADPEPRTPAGLLVEILGNTFAPTFAGAAGPQAALDAVAGLAESVPTLVLDRGTLDDAVRAIADELEAGRDPLGAAPPTAGVR